jgi:ribosomal protein S18 acetylase RimI-like enzyme
MIQVRDLSEADAPDLAPIHRASFQGTMGVALGPSYTSRMLAAYLSHRSGIAVGSFADREPVAYVFGAPEQDLATIQRGLMPSMVRGVLTHPRVLLHRDFVPTLPLRVRALLQRRAAPRETDSCAFALVGIGVSPARRGSGLGRGVLDAFAKRVFAEGHTRISLEVYADNAAAVRLYEAAGYAAQRIMPNVLRYTLTKAG